MNHAVEILKALSEKNRMRIVAALSRYDELCACQMTELLDVSGATASRHLSILQRAGLVDSRKEGRWVYYRLVKPEEAVPLFKWLNSAFKDSAALQADASALALIVGMTREDLCRKQRGEDCCP